MTIAPTVMLDRGPRSAFALTFCLATQHTAPKSSEIRANTTSLANSHLDDCGSSKFHTIHTADHMSPKISKETKDGDEACRLLSVKGFFPAHFPNTSVKFAEFLMNSG